jgi:hypothetical protein
MARGVEDRAMANDGDVGGWTELTIDHLLDLVLLQGNRFIRELLRSKGLPLGTNKEQFEAHLREAIASERLTPAELEEWLADVEGWGNQHVFVFEVPDGGAVGLRQREEFVQRLSAAGLQEFLDAEIPLNPGEELALATIRHADTGMSFLWVRGSAALIRRKELDFEDEVDGDEIEYHAYERRWSRVAARFEWRFDSNLAAVLIARREERDYAEQRDLLLDVIDAAIAERAAWPRLDIARVITQLDSAGLDAAEAGAEQAVRVNFTVFQSAAATIRLAAASEAGSYQDDAAVRDVRHAVDPARFVGGSGDCYLTPTAEPEVEGRELHLRLYGREARVLLWGKMTTEEVWGVMNDLRVYATA